MDTMNLKAGSTQNVFGQNYMNNNINSKAENNSENYFSYKFSSQYKDNSTNDLDKFLMEKQKSTKENRDTSKTKVNSRLEDIKEKFEVFKVNNLAGEKDEIDSSLNFLKEKINRKSNHNNPNPNNISNLNNVSIHNNSVSNSNNTNPNNKINLITPASNRDCGVFDSNFVLKTDKRSFLLNENNINNNSKRKVSEDKREVLEDKKNKILDSLNLPKDNRRNQSNYKTKDINEKLKARNSNNIKDKIHNFVYELDNMNNNIEKSNHNRNENVKSSNFSLLEKTINSKNNSTNFKYNSLNPSTNNDYSLNYASNKKNNSSLNMINYPKNNPNLIVSDNRYNPKSTKNNGNFLITLENLDLSAIGNNYNLGSLGNHNPNSGGLMKFDDGSKLRKEDIRNLANKIRFSSNEDIKKIDEGIVEELLNLAKTINKVFGDSE